MATFTLLWKLVALPCLPLEGKLLHRLGLAALHSGCPGEADRLFDRAALRYRDDLAVESLARVRAHQAIARWRRRGGRDPDALLAIECQLSRLRTIESLEPPFALTDSGRLMASWNPVLRLTPPAMLPSVPSQPSPEGGRGN